MRRNLVVLSSFLFLATGLHAGDAPVPPELPPLPALRDAKTGPVLAAALDPYLQGIAAGGTFSGVVLVALEGNLLYTRAFGVANQEKGTANTPTTRFDIASIGKHFTHVAVGQLLAQGKLALDDTIGKHLPRYPNADAAGKVTIRQLLGHRGGVVDIFAVATPAGRAPASNREWFDLVAPRPLEFEPGTEMRYCNGCYVVLGEIVSALSGMPYERYLAEKVFVPAGMTATAFLDGSAPGAEQAVSYARSAQGLRATSIGPGGRGNGAGGVFSTAGDLLAYENALRGYRLLDRERTGWILGGETTAARAGGRLGVAGGGEGTNAAFIGDGTWTVIVLTNRDPRTGVDVARALAKALGG
ncbi:MAG TPA: serine hydrolase domain-containing protein [Thermoanaerobaculia bacterium]|nr:serine hydrolase domain-containing protein [Thermoanaerobaculia bacterium]